MKTYRVEKPEQLKLLAEAMKDSAQKQSVRNFIAVWNTQLRQNPPKEVPITVTLELGTGAELFRTQHGLKLSMGKLFVRPARDVAKELTPA